jgi:hypothetical protein
MFTLNYEGLNFDDQQLPEFVASVTNHHYGKKVILNDAIATGNYKMLEFPNGFHAYTSNYILHKDFQLELSIARPDYVALHINQIKAGTEFSFSLNNDSVSYDDKIVTSIFLTAGNDRFTLSGSSGACVNRLKIMVPRTWLATQLPGVGETVLAQYLQLGEERLFADALDNTYRTLVDKVMNTEDNAYYLSVTQNIVAVIAERFFSRLHLKLQKKQQGNQLSGRVA